jgi:hypothetical protein
MDQVLGFLRQTVYSLVAHATAVILIYALWNTTNADPATYAYGLLDPERQSMEGEAAIFLAKLRDYGFVDIVFSFAWSTIWIGLASFVLAPRFPGDTNAAGWVWWIGTLLLAVVAGFLLPWGAANPAFDFALDPDRVNDLRWYSAGIFLLAHYFLGALWFTPAASRPAVPLATLFLF